jgi:hypothetical protein
LLERHHKVMDTYIIRGVATSLEDDTERVDQQDDDEPNDNPFRLRLDKTGYWKIYGRGPYTF